MQDEWSINYTETYIALSSHSKIKREERMPTIEEV